MPGKTVLLLCGYPLGRVPGQRFRFEQYLDMLRNTGLDITVRPFLEDATMDILYAHGHLLRKASAVLTGFWRRVWLVLVAKKYDLIFLYREATPIGPPLIEFLLFLLGCRVIYDFDDAIYLPNTSRGNWIAAPLRCPWKIAYITKRAFRVSVSNRFLADWAGQYHDDVRMIPTTIDPMRHTPSIRLRKADAPIVVGWTGSLTTLPFLELTREPIIELQKKYDFIFCVIADFPPAYVAYKNFRYLKFATASEMEDLATFDIGIMPVPDGVWNKGKMGFKAVQYSALEIAPIVSSTGSGPEVVIHGETGLVVENTPEQWYSALERLIRDPGEAARFGKSAREHILRNYSVPSQNLQYQRLFTCD